MDNLLHKVDVAIEQAIPVPDQPKVGGIYLLLDGDEVVYVGQSNNIHWRAVQHRHQSSKQFDRYAYIMCAETDVNTIEAYLILHFAPRYNKKLPQNPLWGSLHVVAHELGLKPTDVLAFIKAENVEAVKGTGYYRKQDFWKLAGIATRALEEAEIGLQYGRFADDRRSRDG